MDLFFSLIYFDSSLTLPVTLLLQIIFVGNGTHWLLFTLSRAIQN